MVTRGIVESVIGDTAKVYVIKKSACENCDACSSKGSCYTELILNDSQKTYLCTVKNKAEAKKGDIVELYSDDRISLVFALITFIFGENGSITASVVAFCVLFISFAFVSDKLSRKYSDTSIRKIIKENSETL